ncbi:MAG TPA: hemerythrin domain-containing protein [Thermoanaerobaculaceae bacterium]|nr:hemerythrin domain-containing protein [Thermoanaerobaculaceae bacterium]HPS79253.1 hemerythrin domain-containing protein [Thermoanaerobaculaceae bacterium]
MSNNQPEAIATLMHEHRVIEQVLDALERCASAIASGQEVPRATVRDFAEFFRNFADRCHHGKEEDRLFTTMVELGFPRDHGPIAVMLTEHELGREQVRALAALGVGDNPLSEKERRQVCAHAGAFIPLLRTHIMREDEVLYPMAIRALTSEHLARLAREFETFEATVMGEGEHQRYHALADRLIAAWTLKSNATPVCCHHTSPA